MVARVHRARYGIDYSPKVISLGPVTLTVDETNVTQKIGVMVEKMDDDSEIMALVADRLVEIVQDNIENGDFLGILPASGERRKWPFLPEGGIGARMAVGGSKPLVASRSLLNGIVARSKTGYAAAQRGKDEWYGFLHNEGIGRLDRRTFMGFSGAQSDSIVRTYDDRLTAIVETD